MKSCTWVRLLRRKIISMLLDRYTKDEQYGIKVLVTTAGAHYGLIVAVIGASLAAGVFEGGTMGILALAVTTLVDSGGAALSSSFGHLGEVVDNLHRDLGREAMFLSLVVLAVSSQLLRSAVQYAGTYMSAHLQSRVQGDMQRTMLEQIMRMSYAQINKYRAGALQAHLNQAATVSAFVSTVNELINNVVMMAAYVGILLWISLPITFGAMVICILFSLGMVRIVHRVREYGELSMRASVAAGSETVEFLRAPRLLRIFAREDYASRRIQEAIDQGLVARRQGLIWKGLITPIFEVLAIIGAGAFLIGGYLLVGSQGDQVLAFLLSFLLVLNRFMGRVSSLNNFRATVARIMPTLREFAGVLRSDNKEYTRQGGRPFSELRDGIVFRDVSLCYNRDDAPAVNGLSFTLAKGTMVALVGQSGGGKSSVADLLLGLYDPTEGQILVDGVGLQEIDLKTWRERIGVVSQDVTIFNGSIRDNIAFARPEAGDAEIIEAAKVAYAHEFIMQMDDGYETRVGDHGYRLSGGQRQRLALARAILKHPEILVLDEATSALDSVSERYIQEAIHGLRHDRTIVTIAHRLSTIVDADQILVLDQGRLVETGRHIELLERNGLYRDFWTVQTSHSAAAPVTSSGLAGQGATR